MDQLKVLHGTQGQGEVSGSARAIGARDDDIGCAALRAKKQGGIFFADRLLQGPGHSQRSRMGEKKQAKQ
eukprot:scaffold75648_cov19-Tisochrysis_lutea.AAC.1